MRLIFYLSLSALIFTIGCVKPEGNGIAGGKIYILGCNENENYGDETFNAYFDLRANFFVGEPIKDEGAIKTENRLDIRLQKGTNTIEDSDSIYIQLTKAAVSARQFANYEPVSVGINENAKASLNLYLTCPTFFDGPEANSDNTSSCPDLTPSEQEELCNTTVYGQFDQLILPHSPFTSGDSCIIFCKFGNAHRGDTISDDFALDFGDIVSGIYFFTLHNRRILYDSPELCGDLIDNNNDGRVDEDVCITPSCGGFVQGNFTVKLRRAKSIQAFP